jgi:hypothetical protein
MTPAIPEDSGSAEAAENIRRPSSSPADARLNGKKKMIVHSRHYHCKSYEVAGVAWRLPLRGEQWARGLPSLGVTSYTENPAYDAIAEPA